jgi:hypothetical protein
MIKMRNRLLLSVLCCLATAWIASAPLSGADKPIDVLLLGHFSPRTFEPWWPRFQEACAKEGVRAHILNEDLKRGLGYEMYTADLLRKFNVVLFGGIPEKTSKHKRRQIFDGSGRDEPAAGSAQPHRQTVDLYAHRGSRLRTAGGNEIDAQHSTIQQRKAHIACGTRHIEQ